MVTDTGGPEDKVVPINAGRRPADLTVALLSAPQLAQDLIGHWLRQVAGSCRLVAVRDAAELRGMPPAGNVAPPFDLLVLWHCLQPGSPDALLGQLRELQDLPIPRVVLAGNDDGHLIGEALRHGVRGYISTRLPLPVAVAAIRLVLSGGVYAPPVPPVTPQGVRDSLAMPRPDLSPAAAERLHLSPREAEVLRLLCSGCSNRQIAVELGISENTVMVHMRHVLRKLGATNRTQAVYKAGCLLAADGKPG